METSTETSLGERIEIRGTVQGVGFRPWVYRLAQQHGIAGRVRNDASGVVIEAFAGPEALREFVTELAAPRPPAHVDTLQIRYIPAEEVQGFTIVSSTEATQRRVSIPPDLALCPECAAEIFDSADRRFRYPFTNCTHCGPRFTIALDVPYDRAATTMSPFRLCGACAREYADPSNRRFHAEPNACPRCGPRLRAVDSQGEEIAGDPLLAAMAALREGSIVALKGVGGFHLACDATSSAAVKRLRERKRREQKPFAIMVRDLDAARALALLSAQEEALLCSAEAPIVLAARRPGAAVCEEVAPRSPLLGLLLPYSPLHRLLLGGFGGPLVMTSGNLAEEPICHTDADALERLGGIADLFLLHDREIATRCDDSVARIIDRKPVVLRRSRGYVPRAIRLRTPVRRPVLAVGGHLKNTFCLAVDDMAVLGPHIGDLDGESNIAALAEAADRMARFLRVRPEVIAHDLHPRYASTLYALGRPEAIKYAVQHHHAHVASAIAEHRLEGAVIGVAFDGTGYGPDGTAWGGEVLIADASGFERIATVHPVALAGGEMAIRQPWRIALAMIDDAFGGESRLDGLALFDRVPQLQIGVVRRMIQHGVNAPLAHGVGRIFDGIGALVLARPESAYEGQVATEWNFAAGPHEPVRYAFEIDREGAHWLLDLRPMVREIVNDLREGRPAASISSRFHATLAVATAALVRAAVAARGHMPVVLTGGCFQNALLAESVKAELAPEHQVYLHGEVPPGDGGLALGQALIADAATRGSDA